MNLTRDDYLRALENTLDTFWEPLTDLKELLELYASDPMLHTLAIDTPRLARDAEQLRDNSESLLGWLSLLKEFQGGFFPELPRD